MTTTWDFPFDSLVSLDRLEAGTNQERSAVTRIVGKNNSTELFRRIFRAPFWPADASTNRDAAGPRHLAALFCDGYGLVRWGSAEVSDSAQTSGRDPREAITQI
jgi:hypothetical protein